MKKRTSIIISILSALGVLIISYLIICIFSYRQLVQKYALKHPDTPKIFESIELGLEYSSQKKFQEAEDAYKKAIELNPNYAPSYYALGICYYGQDKFDEAAEMFRKALELNPQYKEAQIFLKTTESEILWKERESLSSKDPSKLSPEEKERLNYLNEWIEKEKERLNYLNEWIEKILQEASKKD